MIAKPLLVRQLAAQRGRIDALNLQLLRMIEERGRVALAIGKIKMDLECTGVDPQREQEMLRALERQSQGPFLPAELRDIFGALFRASLALQERETCQPERRTGSRP